MRPLIERLLGPALDREVEARLAAAEAGWQQRLDAAMEAQATALHKEIRKDLLGEIERRRKTEERRASAFRQKNINAFGRGDDAIARVRAAIAEGSHLADLAKRLEEAPILEQPFPHLVLDDLLPPPIFELIQGLVPDPDFFTGRAGDANRNLLITYESGDYRHAGEPSRLIWDHLSDQVAREAITPVLKRKFAPFISDRFVDLFGETFADEIKGFELTSLNGRVMLRGSGYDLRPHLDSANFAVTCLYYLAPAGESEALGTSLYEIDAIPELKSLSTYYPEDEEGITSRPVKTVAFRPNRFIAFPNSRRALHGVTLTDQAPAIERLVYQFHLAPYEWQFHALLRRLPKKERARWERYFDL